jgi:hypothetical protein
MFYCIMFLFISYLTSQLHIELKIRPDIRYPAFRLAGYPAKLVSGAPLLCYHFFREARALVFIKIFICTVFGLIEKCPE